MKFSYLKTSVAILLTCLVLSSNLGIALAYSFGHWGESASSSNTTATATVAAKPKAPRTNSSLSNSTVNQNDGVFWPELRRSFTLDHYTYNRSVQNQINWFRNHPEWLSKTLTKATPYMYYVYSQVEKRNLPGELVLLPVIESAYDPFAYSDKGAAGLWQLMPGTASGYGLRQDWWYDGRRDIYASTNAALDYLTYLQNFFNGDWLYAIASYDAGQGTIQNAITYNAERDRSTDFWDLPLSNETNAYVSQLLALAAIIANPQEFGITLPNLPDGPYFAEVNVGPQINLATAAKMAGISLAELYKLNPGYNRWATDPNGPPLLLLPVDTIDTFKQNLAALPAQAQVSWNHYQVKAGESLGSIAAQFGTRIALLQEMNKLNSNILHSGQIILVPNQNSSQVNPKLASTEHTKASNSIVVGVNMGDSLWSLALKYQVQPEQIIHWNHLPANAPLHVGQKLVIFAPQHTQETVQNHSSQQSTAPKTAASIPTSYKVTSGNTLDGIAKKFGTTAEAIASLNHLGNSMLHLGEELKIPTNHTTTTIPSTTSPSSSSTISKQVTPEVTKTPIIPVEQVMQKPAPTETESPSIIHYTIKAGDTLSSIAKAHRVSIQDLQRWNKAYLGKYLRLGQELVIYQ